MTLKEAANGIGVHESTVSTAINGKYMDAPFGTFELPDYVYYVRISLSTLC